MGAELGQESEWAEARELDWWLLDHPEHAGVHALVRDLNRVYADTPALWSRDHEPEAFSWIDANDASRNAFSFARRGDPGPDLVCVANFSAIPHDYRLGLPSAGTWEEVLNTDAKSYGGSGVGNLGQVESVAGEHSGQPAHADIALPPLGVVWLRRAESPPESAAPRS
jgi:1,4-alpha-glucan branching enzyme